MFCPRVATVVALRTFQFFADMVGGSVGVAKVAGLSAIDHFKRVPHDLAWGHRGFVFHLRLLNVKPMSQLSCLL